MTTIKTTAIALVSLVLCLVVACSPNREPTSEETKDLQVRIETATPPQFVSNDEHSLKLWDWTRQVYSVAQFRPAWMNRGRIHAKTDIFLRTLENAPNEGLHSEDFALSDLKAKRVAFKGAADLPAQSQFDLQLTYSLVSFVSQLCFGRVEAQEIHPKWSPKKTCDVPRLVADALQQNAIEGLTTQLAPKFPEYQNLKVALQQYRDMAAKGVRATLLEGEGLPQFQSRHGLEPKGKLDKKTVSEMEVPAERRIEQIEINMDRMRWMADTFEPRHLRVNVAAFQLEVHEGDQIPLEMRVIVGSDENRTPLLDGEMEHVVFSPYWNIPESIVTKELLPKIAKDPDYLRKEQIEIVRGSGDQVELRQKPGASNALGLVKFLFPNPYNVYLHDTPGDNLFARLTRNLSHGCIRLERPAELAAYVLQDQPEWTGDRIEQAMHGGKEKWVPLKAHLPVHIFYWTAWADADGRAQFRPDVYGFDEEHRKRTPDPFSSSALPAANATHIDVDKI